jgi:predicted NBD/HSP70 family sugar kinase
MTHLGDSAGHLLQVVRAGRAATRRDLQEVTGLSRSTVAQRVELLVAAGYLRETGRAAAARGRPSHVLELDESGGLVLAADLGVAHASVAVCDLAGRPVAELSAGLRLGAGPQAVLGWLEERWRELLEQAGTPARRVLGFGVSVPGPVDVTTGRTVHQTPVMPGWFDHPVRDQLEAAFGVPGFVDNDANAMAFGEYSAEWREVSSLLFVKASTGIGAGMVVDGRLVRGADSGSGDIGHVKVTSADDGPLCVCGARGCLAAAASGRALARRLREEGFDVDSSRAAVALAQTGEERATRLLREAGLVVGDVLATAVSLLNPRVLVLGGDLVTAGDHFVGAVRERLYLRTQPQAARRLQVVASAFGDRAGVLGAARLVLERVLAPEAVDHALAAARPAEAGAGV